MVVGELLALLVTVALPVTLPVTAGAKVAFNVAVCPGVRICPVDTPLTLKPAPEMLTLEMVTLELPEAVSVAESVLLPFTTTFGKFKLDTLEVSCPDAALTVRIAALLVTLPALLLTRTVNCAPLSE